MPKYNYSMNENTYLTPPELVKRGLSILAQLKKEVRVSKFDLDVCCASKNIPAHNYYMYPEHDGLIEDWLEYNWCNPPFEQSAKWVKKAFKEQQAGRTSILLIPVRTETAYWHNYILFNKDVDIYWIRKGPRFINPTTLEPMGVFKNALAFVVFKGVKHV